MRPLDATELLDIWEQGLNQPPLQRALMLVTAASPELDADAVAGLSIGARDARLLQLREWMFGPRLLNTAQCPQCLERVEWEGRTTDLRVQAVDDERLAKALNLEVEGFQIQFRLPDSGDVAAVMALPQNEEGSGVMTLIKRCIISAKRRGKTCDVVELPQQVLDVLSRRIEQLDPLAEIRTELTCPECSHQWDVLFDISGFLWIEINNWAERTLRAIDRLATAYGWTEAEILKLSPVRRQLYLGMVNR